MEDEPRKTAADFDPQVLGLYDRYVHGLMDRRAFLGAAGRLVGATAAVGLLAALTPRFAEAQQVAADDPRLRTSRESFDSPDGSGTGKGYFAAPIQSADTAPRVLVIHENRGLNPHIEDVTRRMALAGYAAFAPDALSPLGGYPGDEDAARTLFGKLDQAKLRADFEAAARWLMARRAGQGKFGAVGFCWGGAMVNHLATRLPELAAGVPFYGVAPDLDAVPKIRAELLVVLAADDERVNATWPAYRQALEAAQVRHSLYQPEGTVHGFHNDTTPRYDQAAAREAWTRTLALFERQLRSA
jgi:carboxymethylenebutenolidase